MATKEELEKQLAENEAQLARLPRAQGPRDDPRGQVVNATTRANRRIEQSDIVVMARRAWIAAAGEVVVAKAAFDAASLRAEWADKLGIPFSMGTVEAGAIMDMHRKKYDDANKLEAEAWKVYRTALAKAESAS